MTIAMAIPSDLSARRSGTTALASPGTSEEAVQDLGGAMTVGSSTRSRTRTPCQPLGISLWFADDVTRIIRTDVRDVPELAGQVPIKDRMAHALKAGALTFTELAAILQVDIETVGRTAVRYKDQTSSWCCQDSTERSGSALLSPNRTLSDRTHRTLSGRTLGGTGQTPPLSLREGVRCPTVRRVGKESTHQPLCLWRLDWNAIDVGWRCAGCGQVRS